MGKIKIVGGRRGWHLRIGDLYICKGFGSDIKAIESTNIIPYASTEWVSIEAIRNFWNEYRVIIIASLNKPYISEWGVLKLTPKEKATT